jgi:hypothetical protein
MNGKTMTPKQWALFGAVQALGIALVSTSNLHTDVLPFVVGFFALLLPGILISSKMNLGGAVQSAMLAVVINAVFWHLALRVSRKSNSK